MDQCERCKKAKKIKGCRFCTICVHKLIDEMEKIGYLSEKMKFKHGLIQHVKITRRF